MTRKELHKAAEEYMKSRKSWPQSHSVTVWHPEIERVVCIPVSEIMADFYLHQIKQEEQPQANDGGKFPKSTWEIDALRRKVKRFEEEIQSIKQANAELMEKAKSEAIKWRKLGDNSIMRDECITKANVWEEIVAYLQQND